MNGFVKENKLITAYISKNINLHNEDPQFSKYGLITYSDSMRLINAPSARLYDSRIDKTIFLNIPLEVANKLNILLREGIIERIAFKPKLNILHEGEYSGTLVDEFVEYGKIFSVENLKTVLVTKMVDANYQDSLWIKVDNKNKSITFEEILQNHGAIDSCVVTQVIHLEYSGVELDYYITHLDHEYIYYSADEFQQRLFDSSQKGTFKQRVKTFKIDNSRIPIIDTCNDCFLSFVLFSFFKKKDLLTEYFQKTYKEV